MTLQDSLRAWVQANETTIVNTLRYLVSIDTQNRAPDGSEHAGQMAVAALLNTLGCEVDVYEVAGVPGLLDHPQYWDARPCTGRPNVMGIRRGAGGGRSLLFSGHIDTVPVGQDAWRVNPWGGEVHEGKLWGLGAYDMKAGLAASIMAVKALNDLGITLAGDLMIESVVDEEFGGANGTLAARLKYNADFAVVPEPTNLVVCPAHHGGLMLRVTFRGGSGWGFSPDRRAQAATATTALAHFVDLLNTWAAHRLTVYPPPPLYRDNPDLPVLVNQIKAGDVSLPFFADRVPSHAWLTVWIEAYPGATAAQVVADVQDFYRRAQASDAVLAQFEPEWTPLRWLDGSAIDPNHAGVQTFAGIVSDVRGQPAVVRGAPFACDGHMFNLYSPTPMLLLGPAGGNPHAPDEFVDVDAYLRLVEIFVLGAVRWCGEA